jgi:hypothetical protein
MSQCHTVMSRYDLRSYPADLLLVVDAFALDLAFGSGSSSSLSTAHGTSR